MKLASLFRSSSNSQLGLVSGMAYFIETDYKSAMTKLLKVVDRAVALDTRITYAQSIEY